MGTKEHPGRFDCYETAKPDEPMFVLLARDPLADRLVELWAEIRGGNTFGALDVFNSLLQSEDACRYIMSPTDPDKIAEARACVESMRDYRVLHDFINAR